MARSAFAQPTPAPAGEIAVAVATTEGPPLALTTTNRKPWFATSLPAGESATPPLLSRDLAFVASHDRIAAIALRSGKTRWVSPPAVLAYPGSILIAGTLLFVESSDFDSVIALRRDDGQRAYTLPGVYASGVLDGILYANRADRTSFVAFGARDGKVIWETPGGGQHVSEKPLLVGTTLLQPFSDSGALTVTDVYAFDVRTGHARWMRFANSLLTVSKETAYIDSTWFPEQLDNYVPLSVAHVDITRGTVLDEQTYTPDPDRNAHPPGENPARASAARVAAGYVYLRVRGTWYRYDADRSPAQAHPSRLGGIDILDWFDDGALLVVAHGELAVARPGPNGFVLHRVAAASRHSGVVQRSDGTRYVFGSGALYAIDPKVERGRRVGTVPCRSVDAIDAWDAHVDVLCSANGRQRRAIGFDDTAPVRLPSSTPAPRPEPPPAPRFIAHVKLLAVPPARGGAEPSWMGPAAPLPSDDLVFVAIPDGSYERAAIGRANPNGTVDFTLLPGGSRPPWPDDLVVDGSGTIWVNDGYAATVSAVAADGSLTTRVVGDPGSGRGTGIRLAIGPDGAIWYARSHPTREIARLDGRAHFAVPDDAGQVVRLRGDRTGFWYVATSGIGHIDTNGRFTRVIAPTQIGNAVSSPLGIVLAPGTDGTAWIAFGTHAVHLSTQGILRNVGLPNATATIAAATVGCDGALYAAESVPQIARIAPDGRIDEFPLDLRSFEAIVTAANCGLWFTAISHTGQAVGTLTLTPR